MFSIGLGQADASIPMACETQHSETEPNGDALVLQQLDESVAKTCGVQHYEAEPDGDAHTLQVYEESVNKITIQAEDIVGRLSVAACATHQCSTFCEECMERTYACVCVQFPSHRANPNGEGSVADRNMSACPAKGAEPNGEALKRDSWVYDKEQGNLIRIHVCERKGFFNPNGVKECPVDLALFASTRTTTMHTMRGKQYEVFHRNWRENKLSRAWTGQTVFKILDKPFVPTTKNECQENTKVTSGKQAVGSHIRHAMEQCHSVRRTAESIDKIDQTIERLDQELRALRESLSEDVAAAHSGDTERADGVLRY